MGRIMHVKWHYMLLTNRFLKPKNSERVREHCNGDLKKRGGSFQIVLDEACEELARHYLKTGNLSGAEISFMKFIIDKYRQVFQKYLLIDDKDHCKSGISFDRF